MSAARARSPRGPWEGAPGNPLLSHSGTARRIQNTGHADLVQAPDGGWWMVLLGVRPRGFTPDVHVLGRETFLTPVEWDEDGWPVVAPVPERHAAPGGAWHPVPAPPARDDFDGTALAPHWISPFTRPEGSWSLTERPGSLVLHATGPTLDTPATRSSAAASSTSTAASPPWSTRAGDAAGSAYALTRPTTTRWKWAAARCASWRGSGR